MSTSPRSFTTLATRVLLVPALFIASCATGGSGGGDAVAGVAPGMLDTPVENDHVTLIVYGMSCPLCANNIDQQLLRLGGVETVDVNLASGEVGVQLGAAPRPTYGQLIEAVERSGFTLRRVEMN